MVRPGAEELERPMLTNRCVTSLEVKNPENIRLIRTLSNREGIIYILVDNAIYEKRPSDDEHPKRAQRTEDVSQAILTDAIARMPGLIEDTVTALFRKKAAMKVQEPITE